MAGISTLSQQERDAHFLRRSFEIARRAMSHGNHPFGALLVDAGGKVLLEAENGYMPAHDGTAHAERLLATQACTTTLRISSAPPRSIRPPSPARCARGLCTGPGSAGWSMP